MADATQHERWAPIPGHEGYEASDLGRVRSLDRTIVHKNGNVQRRRGIVLRLWQDANGYWICRCGDGRPYGVHVLVLSAFIGARPNGMFGLHNNGDSSDSRLSNLRWGTPTENSADTRRHGTNHYLNRTHCIRGHALSGDNLNPPELKAKGHRTCRACVKAAARISRFRKRGVAVPDMQEESDRMYAQILAGYPNGHTLRKATTPGHDAHPFAS